MAGGVGWWFGGWCRGEAGVVWVGGGAGVGRDGGLGDGLGGFGYYGVAVPQLDGEGETWCLAG